MSILIKGMEMPEDCFSCPLREEGACNITGVYAALINKKNSDCPLVELPKNHGRLIDADKLKADYDMGDECMNCPTGWKSCQYHYLYNKMDFCGWIDDQPTVVERERS